MTRPRRVLLGGICAGLADHLGRPVRRIRFFTVLLALCGGAGALLYLWLWALTPLVPAESAESSRTRRLVPVATILAGLAFIAMLVTTSIEPAIHGVVLNPGVPAVAILAGASVFWTLAFDRHDPARSERSGVIIRSSCAVLLMLTGIALLFGSGPLRAVTAVASVFLLVLGVGVLVAPQAARLWKSQMSQRASRVREVQRAEIAAHLHDSVLQTLALIQNRAGASSEVARLARAQERELRDWLFAGTTPVGDDFATEVREAAAAIELDYPARLEVVVVGESTGPSNPALFAATREAMVNAARHVGGEISVYLELSARASDVYVRDRGPGFDVDALPADRLGVRESIIGRMSRAGGIATVGPGVGGTGTEIHLHLETETVRG